MPMLEVLAQVVLFDLVSPITFVPAIAVGWFARTLGQRIGGIVLLAAFKIGVSYMQPLPDPSQRVWSALAMLAVAPAIWAFATAALRDWFQDERATDASSPRLGRTRTVVGAAIGAPVGAIIGTVLGLVAIDTVAFSGFEGAAGYAVAFLFFLPGLVLGAVLGAVLATRWGAPKS